MYNSNSKRFSFKKSFLIPATLAFVTLFSSFSVQAAEQGLHCINGKYYYADETGTYVNGWYDTGSYVYYFTSNGARTGLTQIGKKIFLFNESGELQTGWQIVSGNKYYFKNSGSLGKYGAAIKNKTVTIDGESYSFDKYGVCSTTSSAPSASSSSSSSGTMTTTTPGSNAEFVRVIGNLAHEDMKSTGVLASITIAQAIVESNYGKSSLTTEAYNLFGMKGESQTTSWSWASPWDGSVCTKLTQEYVNGSYVTISAKFRAYTCYEQSIADHSAYLANAKLGDGTLRYKGLVGNKNYKKVAQIIKDGGYATAPNYVTVLCKLVEQYDLTQYD